MVRKCCVLNVTNAALFLIIFFHCELSFCLNFKIKKAGRSSCIVIWLQQSLPKSRLQIRLQHRLRDLLFA